MSRSIDHVIRLGIIVEPFYWHFHLNSDETFLVIEGVVCIEDRILDLLAGQLFTLPAKVKHRTRSKEGRSGGKAYQLVEI